MYSDFENQLINLSRYAFSFIVVFVLWPVILFKGRRENGMDTFVSRYVLMVFLTIAIVYVLVLIRLYELISLTTILVILSVRSIAVRNGSGSIREIKLRFSTRFYDCLDGRISLAEIIMDRWNTMLGAFRRAILSLSGSFSSLGTALLLASVFLYSTYLRFYDAVVHAAPGMSDAYVTLAWMKYIERRILFHDGIYPHGFHIYLSVIHKFAANDPLYALKYTGPLSSLFTVLGLYFVVSRMTGRAIPGIIAAFTYGALAVWLPIEWIRQASTNSQEFAIVFLLPALYYTLNYLRYSRKKDLWTAAAAFAVIGWVHTLIFVFLAVGVFLMSLAYLAGPSRKNIRPVFHIVLAGVGAGLLSVVPAALGLIMGRSFYGSAADFATAKTVVGFPAISMIDGVALGGILLFFIVGVFLRTPGKDALIPVFVLTLGFSSFVMYMALGPLTGSTVFATRTGILWSLMVPMGIGFGWNALWRLVEGKNKRQVAELIMGTALIGCCLLYYRPEPAQPYKMQYDSMVDQYLRISREFRPTEWMIVSAEEGYALTLGRGWHLMLGDFLEWYNPENTVLSRSVNGRVDVLETTDIFIFREKNMFKVDFKEMESIMDRRKREYVMLDVWLEKYQAAHSNASIYYEDANIQVIRIHQPKSREEIYRHIWEGKGNGS